MTSRANLIPTSVTDKNGRATTVHKRLDASKGTSKALAASTPVITSESASAGTPLPPVALLSPSEKKAFKEWHQTKLGDPQKHRYDHRKAFVLPHDDETEALAWRLLQTGKVNEYAVFNLLNYHHLYTTVYPSPHYTPESLHTNLRVFESLAKEDPSAVANAGPALKDYVDKVLRGYCCNIKASAVDTINSIDTDEKLASLTAVTIFLYHAGRAENHEQFKRGAIKDSEGTRIDGDVMANKTLDLFLRENPGEVHRVVSYMQKRELGTKVRDTKALIEYLRENDHSTLDQGWL